MIDVLTVNVVRTCRIDGEWLAPSEYPIDLPKSVALGLVRIKKVVLVQPKKLIDSKKAKVGKDGG